MTSYTIITSKKEVADLATRAADFFGLDHRRDTSTTTAREQVTIWEHDPAESFDRLRIILACTDHEAADHYKERLLATMGVKA